MPLLLLASFIWAFSFGLIKGRLAGLDSAFISAARLGLALLVFLPFLRTRGLPGRTLLALHAIGAVQFGLMYLAYNESFRYLQAHEVALFTTTTPILVILIADALERTLRWRALLAALVAVIAALPVLGHAGDARPTLTGLLLVQLSNAAFAAGQVGYRRLCARHPGLRAREVFGLLYGGAFAVALAAFLLRAQPAPVVVTPEQFLTLAYLGVVASGLGFFLWNIGATRAGTAALAVLNNAKIPLAVACSLVFFGERAELLSLGASLALMGAAVWLAESRPRPE